MLKKYLTMSVFAEGGDRNGNGNSAGGGMDRDDGGVGGIQPTTTAGARRIARGTPTGGGNARNGRNR